MSSHDEACHKRCHAGLWGARYKCHDICLSSVKSSHCSNTTQCNYQPCFMSYHSSPKLWIIRQNDVYLLKNSTNIHTYLFVLSLILDCVLQFFLEYCVEMSFPQQLTIKIKTTRDLIFDELIPICKFLVCFCCVKLHILPTRDNTSIAQEPRICTHISIQICAIFFRYFVQILKKRYFASCVSTQLRGGVTCKK